MRSRGRRQSIASALADALVPRTEARLTATAAVFAEVCGWPMSREAAMRGITQDGRLIVVARTPEWASQLNMLSTAICEKVNLRLGRRVATGLEVRVGPIAVR